ncbi:hypothetical protein D9615_001280 [Tricholomella constricta]|uniref:DUF605-domain-containing protein n=1 Tax=Tricholomella constricta TaxID=117010 RepID=A0A8H5HKY6_9AGAR|nr:hypothetical protein D9615_001280 [Tricholomella constricta]
MEQCGLNVSRFVIQRRDYKIQTAASIWPAMSSQSFFGLPPVSSALKPISPYLQRAHELRTQDPIMAYWCAYHAAQLGISLKAKDSASRDILFALLGILEHLKKEIGAQDALDVESVSSAYVENFALKVFAMADNEDRAGSATRSTAKKFLAAANFLEVLKIFPKAEISESTEDKIKYAKWKAADIAKAFREGRKPTPGPAGSLEEDRDAALPASPSPLTTTLANNVGRSSQASGSGSDQSTQRVSPPSHIDVPRGAPAPFAPQPQTPPRYGDRWGGEGEATPGSWSTAATPGTAQHSSVEWDEQPSLARAAPESKNWHNPRSGSGSSSNSGGAGGIFEKTALVNGELESHNGNEYYASYDDDEGVRRHSAEFAISDDSFKKSVHFTPSVVGGLSDSSVASSSAPMSSSYDEPSHIGGDEREWPVDGPIATYGGSHPPQQSHPGVDLSILPPGFIPDPHQAWVTGVGAPPPTRISPPSAPNHDVYISSQHSLAPEQASIHHNIYALSAPPPPPQHDTPPSPPPTFELTPSSIAKAQKHSRFAISALDYEDAATARKELRAALATLGG